MFLTIFQYSNYKKYVLDRIQQMPKRGYGQFSKMAKFLSINSVNVTQIFKGHRDLTVEQACLLQEFFGFTELEGQYFVGLVELERAGHHKLKAMIRKRLDEVLRKSENLKTRIPSQKELSEEVKAIFYSAWYNSAIRLATSIPSLQTPDAIAEYFDLPISHVNRTLQFLADTALIIKKNDKYVMGPSSTHLEAGSPLIGRHHTNWRNKAIQKADFVKSDELMLSMPCSISSKARALVRNELVNAIEKISTLIDSGGTEEELLCLNIDWIEI